MAKQLNRILLVLGILFILLAAPLVWFSRERIKDLLDHRSKTYLEVDFLDVGQGDAILIKTPAGQNILIDGGPDSKVVQRLGENLPFWDRTIDLVVLTHPHDDHVNGLIDVLNRYKVSRVVYSGVVHTSPGYLEWLKTLRDKKTPLILIDRPQLIQLGPECRLEVIWPRNSVAGESVENLNDSSIVMKLIYADTSFLLTGDAETAVEDSLLSAGVDVRANVYKVPHHGSDSSSNESYLKAVNPDIAIISDGKDNSFGHPSPQTLNRLKRLNVQVYRTDQEGTIKMVSDGAKINILER